MSTAGTARRQRPGRTGDDREHVHRAPVIDTRTAPSQEESTETLRALAERIEAAAQELGQAYRETMSLLDRHAAAAFKRAGEPGASDVRARWGVGRVTDEIAATLLGYGLEPVLSRSVTNRGVPGGLAAVWERRARGSGFGTNRTKRPRELNAPITEADLRSINPGAKVIRIDNAAPGSARSHDWYGDALRNEPKMETMRANARRSRAPTSGFLSTEAQANAERVGSPDDEVL